MPPVTDSYNLAALHPEVAAQWALCNTGRPETTAPRSGLRKVWQCRSGHIWEATVANRTGPARAGCPFCSGFRATPERNLAVTDPELAAQWSPNNPKPASAYLRRSDRAALWVCSLGHEWRAVIGSRTAGAGCPYCSGYKATADRSLAALYPGIAAQWTENNTVSPHEIGPGVHIEAEFSCALGHVWRTAVYHRTHPTAGTGCPYCSGNLCTPQDSIVVKFPELMLEWSAGNARDPLTISRASEYEAEWKCANDKSHTWTSMVCNRTRGAGCPHCATSRGERELLAFVQSLGFSEAKRTRSGGPICPREIDVWVPSKNIGIEYDGLYWHSESRGIGPAKRVEKFLLCRSAGIRLISVVESDWLHRRGAVEGYLRSVLGAAAKTVGARKTVVAELPLVEARQFMETHHVMGSGTLRTADWIRALLVDGAVVAVMHCKQENLRHARGTSRRWVLARYCVASGVSVSGGFAKMWAAFLNDTNPETVVSFSDRKWSEGGLYRRHGFQHDGEVAPSYWYFRPFERRLHHKAKFQKNRIGALPHETEIVAAKRLGWHRIYDLGLDRWVWSRPPRY